MNKQKARSWSFIPLIFIALTSLAKAQTTGWYGAEQVSEKQERVQVSKTKTQGTIVRKFDKGAWVRFDVDFGTGYSKIKVKMASGAHAAPTLEIRKDSPDGEKLAKLVVKRSGWNVFEEQTADIPASKGKQQLYLVAADQAIILSGFELLP